MRILALVNGPRDRIYGIRLRQLLAFSGLAGRADVLYRDGGRRQSFISFTRALLECRPTVAYVEAFAWSGVLPALFARFVQGTRFVLSTGDDAAAFQRGEGRPVLALLAGIVERLSFRIARPVCFHGPDHAEEVGRLRRGRAVFLPNSVDTDLFRPGDSPGLRERLGLTGKLVLGVVGSIHWNARHRIAYGWEVLEIVRRLAGLPVAGLVVGDGDGLPRLRARAVEYGIADRVAFPGQVPHEIVPEHVNAIDVCFSTQSNDRVGFVRVTAKLPEYLACGRYVIASDVGGARRYLPGIGTLLSYSGVHDPTFPERAAAVVRSLLADRSPLARARELGPALAR
ncbi:MAG: glycosyltransferase, partial [Planctomycetes bacterium]|nr:glycosyltransferase [Planctomycetota bacterium]